MPEPRFQRFPGNVDLHAQNTSACYVKMCGRTEVKEVA